jgi:FkbM family methyltransferase
VIATSHRNWVTRLNAAVSNLSPDLAVLSQRAYMKASQTARPVRRFRTFYGAAMEGNVNDFVLKRICFFSIFEPSLTRFMMDTIKPGQTVADLGANHGYFTLLMSKLVGENGRVIAIEAFPKTCESLRANLALNGIRNVDVKAVAVSDRKGTIEMVAPDAFNSGMTTTLVENHQGSRISVPSDTLMSVLGEAAGSVAFIKIDIEGAERAPLSDILANRSEFKRPLTIVSEVSKSNSGLAASFTAAGFETKLISNAYDWQAYLNAANADASLHGVEDWHSETDDYIFRLT